MKRGPFWRWLGLAALALGFYSVFLLAFAPADYLARSVMFLSRGAVILQQPNGTFWRGSGTFALGPIAPTSAQPLGKVQWTVKPWHLLTGSVVIELKLIGDETDVQGTLGFSLRRYAVYDVVAVAPVRLVAAVYPAASAMGLSGRLRFTSAALEITKDAWQGSGELLWDGAASRLLPITQTGHYKMQLDAAGKRANIRLSTLQGVLQVEAQGEWRALEDGVLRLQGTVAAAPLQPALEPVLNSIGSPQADGRRSFTYETQLIPLHADALFLF